MRALRLVGALTMLVALTGCSGEDPVMPDVTGEKLDAAQTAIEDAGFDEDVEVEGGGLFGVIEEANWVVCEQSPPAGEALSGAPRLVVDRSCDDEGASEEPEPTEEASEEPEPEPTQDPSETEGPEEPEPTQDPSQTEGPEEPEVITARNNDAFAALLALDNECAGSIKTFAQVNAGQTIKFNGAILNMVNHGSYDTRYDILLGGGDFDPNFVRGPYFKYEDVGISDLNLSGKIPNRIGTGDEFTFTATVGKYVPNQCLLFLDPETTRVR